MPREPKKLLARGDRIAINHDFGSVDDFITEYVSNISASGVFIRTREPLAIGTKVNLKFTVIMDDLETMEGIGEVVRVQDDPPGMGVVFLSLTSHSQDLLVKLLTRRQTSERPRRAARSEGPKPR